MRIEIIDQNTIIVNENEIHTFQQFGGENPCEQCSITKVTGSEMEKIYNCDSIPCSKDERTDNQTGIYNLKRKLS